MCYLYKYVQNGTVVYIGKTKRDIAFRIREHKAKRDLPLNCDIFYAECMNEAEMNVKEVLLINKYKPCYNIDCNPTTDSECYIEFEEPSWRPFVMRSPKIFLGYEMFNYKLMAVYETNGKITRKKPEYCTCDIDMPFTEEHETYTVQKCSFCCNLIRNSYRKK